MRHFIAAALLLVLAGCSHEQQEAAESGRQLTIDRIFASPDLSGPKPRSLKLSPDGRYATVLQPRPDDRERYDLWAMDTSTGKMRMLIDSKKLAGGEISEAEKMPIACAPSGRFTGLM